MKFLTSAVQFSRPFGVFGGSSYLRRLVLLKYALSCANFLEKPLVLDFSVDMTFVRQYCQFMGFHWILSDDFIVVASSSLFSFVDSVLAFSEFDDVSMNLEFFFTFRLSGNHFLYSRACLDPRLSFSSDIFWVFPFSVWGYERRLLSLSTAV